MHKTHRLHLQGSYIIQALLLISSFSATFMHFFLLCSGLLFYPSFNICEDFFSACSCCVSLYDLVLLRRTLIIESVILLARVLD